MKRVFPKQFHSLFFGNEKAKNKTLTLRVHKTEIKLFEEAFFCSVTTDFDNVAEYMSTQDLVHELKAKMAKELFPEDCPFVIHPFNLQDIARINFLLDLHIRQHINIKPDQKKSQKCRTIAENISTINTTLIEYINLIES